MRVTLRGEDHEGSDCWRHLAGVGDPSRSPVEKIVDVPFQPWAKAVYEERQANLQKYDPESRCQPPGIPRMMATPFPFQIFQLTDRVLFIFEGGAHTWKYDPR